MHWITQLSDHNREKTGKIFFHMKKLSRIEGVVGRLWRTRLSDDRKRVGDFACYIALFEASQAR